MIKTDIGTYLPSPTPSPPPPAGGSFIDGLSGVKLTRLTDEKDGAWWGVDIYAYDFDDAKVRCRELSLKLLGEHKMTIPALPKI